MTKLINVTGLRARQQHTHFLRSWQRNSLAAPPSLSACLDFGPRIDKKSEVPWPGLRTQRRSKFLNVNRISNWIGEGMTWTKALIAGRAAIAISLGINSTRTQRGMQRAQWKRVTRGVLHVSSKLFLYFLSCVPADDVEFCAPSLSSRSQPRENIKILRHFMNKFGFANKTDAPPLAPHLKCNCFWLKQHNTREGAKQIFACAEAFRPETSSAALLISHLLSQQGLGIILRTAAVQPLFALEASILRRQGVCEIYSLASLSCEGDVIRAAARAAPNAAVARNYLFANLILRPLTIWRSVWLRGASPTFMCCELICMRLEYAIRRQHSFLKTCTGQVGVINTSLFGFGIVANRRRHQLAASECKLSSAKHSCGF